MTVLRVSKKTQIITQTVEYCDVIKKLSNKFCNMSEILSNVSNSEPDLSDIETESNCNENSSSSEYDDYYLELEEAAHQRQLLLQERLLALQDTMTSLRNQLQEEKAMWKKEVEEMNQYYPNNRLESDSYYDMNNNSTRSVSEFNMLDYEQQMARYQEALARAQSQRRMELQKQIAMSNYKRRLLEIENMCNLELMRVRQSVQYLAPLQKMVSEWNLDYESGDAESRTCLYKESSEDGDKRSTKESVDVMENARFECKALNVYPLDMSKANSSTSLWQNSGDCTGPTSSNSRLYLPELSLDIEK